MVGLLKTCLLIAHCSLAFSFRYSSGGNGSDKYMNGSKVTEILLHSGQTKVDLYCP